jgi:hypothetical protein
MDIGDIMTELKILYKDQLAYPLATCAVVWNSKEERLLQTSRADLFSSCLNILPLIGLRK